MEGTTIIGLLMLIVVFVAVVIWRNTKGTRGEAQVSAILSMLPNSKYCVLDNLLIQSGQYSSQIDHVVVSLYGVFVIETKYYKGWIYGGENSEYWTQNIYGNKYQLRNPLLQNEGHIKAIDRLLGYPKDVPIYNIIAFSRQAKLKVNDSLPVMYWGQVPGYIRSFTDQCLSPEKVEEICNTLLTANVVDRSARKDHVQNAKFQKNRSEYFMVKGLCPRCGGELVLRNGKYGQFYGCSNYPRCKYTTNEI